MAQSWNTQEKTWLSARASELGFDLAGIASVGS